MRYIKFLIFPFLSILLIVLIASQNPHLKQNTVVFDYLGDRIWKGDIGPGYSTGECYEMDLSCLQPGDILIGGWDHCFYGKYSHCGIYIGNGTTVETTIEAGITTQTLDKWHEYKRICILRPLASEKQKQAAIQYLLNRQNQIFFVTAFRNDERYWNCSKIVWAAYAKQGIDLDPKKDLFITPETLKTSAWVQIVKEGGIGL